MSTGIPVVEEFMDILNKKPDYVEEVKDICGISNKNV